MIMHLYKIKVQPIAKKKKYTFHPVSAGTGSTMPRLGDANTHAPHMC